jgi:hypothetical protein
VIHINSILKGDISAKLYVNNEVVDTAYISLDEHFEETEVAKNTETADIRANQNKNSAWATKIASMIGSAPGAIGTIFLIFLILDWLFK